MTPACAEALSYRSPAACQWFFQPSLGEGRGSVDTVVHLCHNKGCGLTNKHTHCLWKGKGQKMTNAKPRSCFWSMSGAAANIEAVSGSWPWTCTVDSITEPGTTSRQRITKNIIPFTSFSVTLLSHISWKFFTSYKLYSDLPNNMLLILGGGGSTE